MYFHNSLIPRGAYFLLPLESEQEATYDIKEKKVISKISFDSNFMFTIYAWLCALVPVLLQ